MRKRILLAAIAAIMGTAVSVARTQDSFVYTHNPEIGTYTSPATSSGISTFNFRFDITNDSYTSASTNYDNDVVKVTVKTHNSSSGSLTFTLAKQDGGNFVTGNTGKVVLWDVTTDKAYPWWYSTSSASKTQDATFNQVGNFTGSRTFRIFRIDSSGNKLYAGEIRMTGTGIGTPKFVTGDATNISQTSATLWGSISPNGATTKWQFAYGTNKSNLNKTSTLRTLGSTSGTSTISDNITGLTAGTTYYYKLIGSNSEGSDGGYIESFTTLQPENTPPTTPSSPSPASGATNQPTSGRLSWSCSDADGDNLIYTVYLGKSTSNWTAYPSSNKYYDYENLEAGTKYYWKVIVSDGTTNPVSSSTWSFTTAEGQGGGCEFPDLLPTNDFYEPTCYLYSLGVLSGADENGYMNVEKLLTRGHLAKIAFRGVYSIKGRDVPNAVPSDNYPTVYSDLNNSSDYYYQPARALLYLEYGDGIAPFDRNRLLFNAENNIARIHVLKVLFETFNIQPNVTGTNNPFPNDADVVNLASRDPFTMGYIRKAYSLGIITEGRPYDNCKRGEAFAMLARIMQKVDAGNITDPNPGTGDYFEPLNITLKTIALGLGLPMGNFNHYTKTSFALSGTVPLTFTHAYNSYNTTLPEVFYGAKDTEETIETYQPLGDGWSHSYHTYLTIVGTVGTSSARVIVHWGGGSIDVYKSNNSKLVPESYGVYDDFAMEGTAVVITSKSQVKYRFEALGGPIYYLTSVTDRNDNTLTINYESGTGSFKRISSVSDGQRSLTFSYRSGTDLLKKVTDPLGRSITFDYSFNSNTNRYQLSSFTDAKNQTTNYEYGSASKLSTSKLLTKIQLPRGNFIENDYDANRRLTKTVSGVGSVSTTQTEIGITTNYGSSIPTRSQVDVKRGSTTSTYNYNYNANNVVTSMTGAENLYVNNTYGNSAHPQLPTKITSNSTNVSNVVYDERGNVTSITVTGDGSLTTSMTYDSMNNLTSITDPKNNETTYSYDSKGNLISVSAPEGVSTSISYSNGLPSEVTNAMGVKTEFSYNRYGNLIETRLPVLNLSSSADYDGASRVTSVTDALSRTTRFNYDKNDNLLSKTDADNHTTSYDYDANDNLTDITNAKDGVTTLVYDNATDWLRSVSFAGATKRYSYNNDGTLDTYTKPDGTSFNYSYDDLGRITSDGINDYNYDSKLRLSSVSGNGKTISFSYDGFNRITGTSSDGHNNSYDYDKNGNCISINDTEYNYDGLNRLTSVTFNGKTINYTYRKDSQLSKVTYPNGMTTEYSYDTVGRLTSKKTKLSSGTVVASYSFELDKVGNIVSLATQEPYSDMNLANESTSYSYNSGNRITKAGDITFSFDENGNTTKRGSESFGWNNYDQLTRAGSTDIQYDPLGLIASYGDITFTTDPLGIGNVLSDSKSGAQYIYGKGLEARVKGSKVSYYVTDVRGSVVAIVDESGNITHKYQYDEFGKVTQKEEADYNPFQYVGKYGVMYLSDHLYYMRARHYDPTIGRFLSEDPIWSTNLYPYADNNPIGNIDPNGAYSVKTFANDLAEFEYLDEALDGTAEFLYFVGGDGAVKALQYIGDGRYLGTKYSEEAADYYYLMMEDAAINGNKFDFWMNSFGYALTSAWTKDTYLETSYTFIEMAQAEKSLRKINSAYKNTHNVSTDIFGKTNGIGAVDMRTKLGRDIKATYNLAKSAPTVIEESMKNIATFKGGNLKKQLKLLGKD